jgi:isoleucyl-tRNA synthetase
VIRQVQQARKSAGLHVSDRIRLWLDGADDVRAAVEAHGAEIAEQTLAAELVLGAAPDGATSQQATVEGHPLTVALERAV